MAGPQENRLDAGLAPATTLDVAGSKITWDLGAENLEKVAAKLGQILSTAEEFGVETGPALRKALEESIEYLGKQQQKMRRGGTALQQAQVGLSGAIGEHRKLKAPGGEYAPYSPRNYAPPTNVDDMSEFQKKAHQDEFNRGEASAVDQQEARREAKAREIAAQLDRDYEEPIATMKSIYGYQEPTTAPPTSGGEGGSWSGGGYTPPLGGSGGYSGPGPAAGGPAAGGHGTANAHTHFSDSQNSEQSTPPDSTAGGPRTPGTSTEPAVPPSTEAPDLVGEQRPPHSTSGPGGGVSPSVLGGVAGGIAGGAALGAIARNGGLSGLLGKGSLSSRGVAPIGGTSKGGSGVLGRSGAGTASAGRGGAASGGRGSGGRGAGGRGGSAAGRGAAGGRGVAGGRGAAGGRGGKTKDQKKTSDQDRFDDGEDWLDDDGVGPAVLD